MSDVSHLRDVYNTPRASIPIGLCPSPSILADDTSDPYDEQCG